MAAQEVAQTAAAAPESSGRRQACLMFHIRHHLYAISLDAVRSVVRQSAITPVPLAASCIMGFMNLRGTLLTVIDGGLYAEREPLTEPSSASKVIVVEQDGQLAGIAVDRVANVLYAAAGETSGFHAPEGAVCSGMLKDPDSGRLVKLLAPEGLIRLLEHAEKAEAADVSSTAAQRGQYPVKSSEKEGEPLREQFVQFGLNGEAYAVPIEAVTDIFRFPAALEQLPDAPPGLLGIGLFRNLLMPIIDGSRMLLGTPIERPGRVICLELRERQPAVMLGLAVHQVSEVLTVQGENNWRPLPERLAPCAAAVSSVYHGAGEQPPIYKLNVEEALRNQELLAYLYKPSDDCEEAPGMESFRPERSAHEEARGSLYLFFEDGGQEFAVPADCVREMVKAGPIAPVPHAPDFIVGVTNIRGQLVTVYDVAKRLELETEPAAVSRIVVTETNGQLAGLALRSGVRVRKASAPEMDQAAWLAEESSGAKWFRGMIRTEDARLVPILALQPVIDWN